MEIEEWPAPTAGWVQSGNLANAPKDQAEVLENWFPTSQGVRVRRGTEEHADIGAAPVRLFSYESTTATLFAATATEIWDTADAFASWVGQTSGDWSTTQISTAGGEFLVGVNGADHAILYNGTTLNPLVDEAVNDLAFDAETGAFSVGETVTGGTSGATAEILGVLKTSATTGVLKVGAITGAFSDDEALTDGGTGAATANIPGGTSVGQSSTITNVATADLSQVWLFKERLFFVEGGTQSAWFLPVESIGGAASEINLGSIFRRGGNLMFGATWSLDSGDGLDDKCVFVSTLGEVAVYEGSDPSSANTWSLVGVYDIGRPLDKHASFRAGGDLAILTEGGIVPISQAIQKDRAALSGAAITYPIEDAWQRAVANRTSNLPISATLWQSQTMLLIGVPDGSATDKTCFVANARTGAWAKYTGWDVRCSVVSDDRLYFGAGDGKVYRAEVGGDDAGEQYTAICVPKFSDMGAEKKFLKRARLTVRAPTNPTVKIKGLADYSVPDISSPAATPAAAGAIWGAVTWGNFVWGAESDQIAYSEWKKVSGAGFAVSAAILVTSNNTTPCDVELVNLAVMYERGLPI